MTQEFDTLDALAKFLQTRFVVAQQAILTQAAQIIQDNAQAKLEAVQTQDPNLGPDGIGHHIAGNNAYVGSHDARMLEYEFGTAEQPPQSILCAAAAESEVEVMQMVGKMLLER